MFNFKVGDRVRRNSFSYTGSSSLGEAGAIARVIGVHPDLIVIKWETRGLGNGQGHGVSHPEYFDLVEEEKPMKKTETELMTEIAKLQQELEYLRSREVSVSLTKTEWNEIRTVLSGYLESQKLYEKFSSQIGE